MLALYKKELRVFFGSSIGYFVIGLFLALNGLCLWFLNTDFNILDAGFADLSLFFSITPWFFCLLIPALTMKSFADEYNAGTLEILKTKPLSNFDLIAGKYLAVVTLIIFSLIPTGIYTVSLYHLATPAGNVDFGSIIGSYIGLLFIASAFTAMGLWISSFSKNQLIVLLSSIVIAVATYYGLHFLGNSSLSNGYALQQIGMQAHFTSIARGVIDTRDLVYFVSVSFIFLAVTYLKMSEKRKIKKTSTYLLFSFLALQFLSSQVYQRFDLTKDKKYSLSATSKNIIDNIEHQTVIRIYLEGDFPAEFKRLQNETKQLLEEFKAINNQIKILFVNPKNNLQNLTKGGLTPSKLTIEENGALTETTILPWATVQYQKKSEAVSLLKNSSPLISQEEQLQNSVQNLEFAFIDAIKKVTSKKKKSIAVLAGNGELDDLEVYSLLKTIGKNYHLAKFTLDSTAINPQKTFEQIQGYDLLFIAKPTEAFTENEKFVLDQYTLAGGTSLWMFDNVVAEMDSLYQTGKTLAYPRDLNLDDFFFRYGARVKSDLVKDLYASKITLASGNTGNKPNYQSYLWLYHPVINSNSKHPIVKNCAPIKLQFPSSIDTLKNDIKKTILLQSSQLSKTVQTPTFVELKSIANKPDIASYKNGNKILGVLLEGTFTSAYKDRIKPFPLKSTKEKGNPTKMIIIADGDITSNQIHKNKPLELGLDKWTQEFYGNKEFLTNAINYLLDDKGLLSIRSKEISLPLLNKEKVLLEKTFWQLANCILPLFFLLIFGVTYSSIRKRKYAKPL